MLPDAPLDEKQPRFQTFVTWGFYACIVLIGYGILNKFDSLDQKVTTISLEMQTMNIKLVEIFSKQNYNDKEIEINRAAIRVLREDVDQLQRKRP